METTVTNKKPSECQNITDVRNEIDNIDNAIISLLGERFKYVKEVVKYKEKTADGIEATDRKKAVLERRILMIIPPFVGNHYSYSRAACQGKA